MASCLPSNRYDDEIEDAGAEHILLTPRAFQFEHAQIRDTAAHITGIFALGGWRMESGHEEHAPARILLRNSKTAGGNLAVDPAALNVVATYRVARRASVVAFELVTLALDVEADFRLAAAARPAGRGPYPYAVEVQQRIGSLVCRGWGPRRIRAVRRTRAYGQRQQERECHRKGHNRSHGLVRRTDPGTKIRTKQLLNAKAQEHSSASGDEP